MLIFNGRAEIERGLTLSLEPELYGIVAARLRQLTVGEYDLAEITLMAVFEDGDTDADLQTGAGISLLTNVLNGAAYPSSNYMPPIDYVHWATPTVCEAIVCIGNSGYAVHVLIPILVGLAPELLDWCRRYST